MATRKHGKRVQDGATAREVLGDVIQENDWLYSLGPQLIGWPAPEGVEFVVLDGDFTVQQLEAIAYWVRTHGDIPLNEE